MEKTRVDTQPPLTETDKDTAGLRRRDAAAGIDHLRTMRSAPAVAQPAATDPRIARRNR